MRTYTVFAADDENSSLRNLLDLLAPHSDFQIRDTAHTGTLALEKLSSGNFDLAFLDLGMPGLTGLEVVKELQNRLNPENLPFIIFVTAFTHQGAEAYNLGAVDYLVKPVSEQRLAAALERFRLFYGSHNLQSECFERKLENLYGLTDKEIQICSLVKQGLIKEEIQDRLCFSKATLKTHLGHLYEKTGLSGDSQNRGGDKFSRLLYLLFSIE